MKKIILLLIFIFPLVLFSQHGENEKPITPFADIGFENGKIVYNIGNAQMAFTTRLLPTVYDKRLLSVRFNNSFKNVSGKYMEEIRNRIKDYVNSEDMGDNPAVDQIEYLKLCALLIIWEGDLGIHASKELDKIKDSKYQKLKEDAKLVSELLNFYRNYNQ